MISTKGLIFRVRNLKQQKKEIPKEYIESLIAQGYYVKEYPDKVDIINIQDTKKYFMDNNISMAKIKKLTLHG